MLFLNQRKRKNGRINIFMTKSSQKDMDVKNDTLAPDVEAEKGAKRHACMSDKFPATKVHFGFTWLLALPIIEAKNSTLNELRWSNRVKSNNCKNEKSRCPLESLSFVCMPKI